MDGNLVSTIRIYGDNYYADNDYPESNEVKKQEVKKIKTLQKPEVKKQEDGEDNKEIFIKNVISEPSKEEISINNDINIHDLCLLKFLLENQKLMKSFKPLDYGYLFNETYYESLIDVIKELQEMYLEVSNDIIA